MVTANLIARHKLEREIDVDVTHKQTHTQIGSDSELFLDHQLRVNKRKLLCRMFLTFAITKNSVSRSFTDAMMK
jgi:hypothetical protein